MNVKECYDYTRLLLDEQDETFVTQAHVQQMLTIAYGQFRQLIAQLSPHILAKRVSITMPASLSYDLANNALAVSILGKTPSATRMQRLLHVADVDEAGRTNIIYRGAASWKELQLLSAYTYLLEGSILYVNSAQVSTLQLTYVPISTVDWTKLGALDNEFIDNFDEFHDVIALLAWKIYNLRDSQKQAIQTPLTIELDKRVAAFKAYLLYGRDMQASNHVVIENDY